MENVEVTRSGHDQFSVVMVRGGDTIRCMVSVALGGNEQDNRTDAVMHRAALSKAKALAKALDAAIDDS